MLYVGTVYIAKPHRALLIWVFLVLYSHLVFVVSVSCQKTVFRKVILHFLSYFAEKQLWIIFLTNCDDTVFVKNCISSSRLLAGTAEIVITTENYFQEFELPVLWWASLQKCTWCMTYLFTFDCNQLLDWRRCNFIEVEIEIVKIVWWKITVLSICIKWTNFCKK